MYKQCKNESKTQGEIYHITFIGTGFQLCVALFPFSVVYDFYSLEMYENIYWFLEDLKKVKLFLG